MCEPGTGRDDTKPSPDLPPFPLPPPSFFPPVCRKPLWWGRMPWEDILVGSLLSGVGRVHHHDGFKAAWQDCDRLTVLKHLDYDAPALQVGPELGLGVC